VDKTTLDTIRYAHQHGEMETALRELDAMLPTAEPSPHLEVLRGVLLLQSGQGEVGHPLVEEAMRQAIAAPPDTSAWASDLGMGCLLLGQVERALEILERAISLPGPDAAAWTRLGVVKLLRDDPEGAEAAFEQAALSDPDRAELHSNLGGAKTRLGKLEEALSHYEQALRLNPALPQAINGRDALLLALDRAEEAVLDMETRLEEADNLPDPVEAVLLRRRIARLLEEMGRFQEALARLREATREDTGEARDNFDAVLELATLLYRRERLVPALAWLTKAVKLDPEHVGAKCLMARVLSETGAHDRAATVVAQAVEALPDAPACLMARAEVRSATGDEIGAEQDLRRAVEMYPGLAEAWGALGHLLLCTGKLDEAESCLSRAADLNPIALASLVEARTLPDDPQAVERMERLVDNPLLPREPRAALHFALTKLLERKEEYHRAFGHAKSANELLGCAIGWDPEQNSKTVQNIAAAFTPDLFEKLQEKGSSSQRPIFVVGMPRSGTTLTEQILAGHPQVFGAGELGFIANLIRLMPRVLKTNTPYPRCLSMFKPWMADHAAAYYLKKIAGLDPEALKVVDKMPHNFLHLGLIALAFPNASIIHVRRDPRDVAVSNYFTNFRWKHGGLGYAFDLEHIGQALNDHRFLMDHWRKVLPIPLFELKYEELVEHPQETVRNMLDFVGLPWDDRVMEFHEARRPVKTASVWQVRKPLYATSKQRWRRYREYLGPLFAVLDQSPHT
jgi:tetratricopeptide (TPR) repeat protein